MTIHSGRLPLCRKASTIDYFEALDNLCLFLAVCVLELFPQLRRKLIAIDLGKQLLNCFCADSGFKIILVFFPHLPILPFGEDLAFLQRGETGIDDDIICKIQNLFQHTRCQVQHQTHSARDTLKVPDMADRGCKFNVPHSFTADFALRHFDTAAVADLALIADLLILAAVAFPVLRRSENALTEETVTLRFQCTVIDRLRLFHFAV